MALLASRRLTLKDGREISMTLGFPRREGIDFSVDVMFDFGDGKDRRQTAVGVDELQAILLALDLARIIVGSIDGGIKWGHMIDAGLGCRAFPDDYCCYE